MLKNYNFNSMDSALQAVMDDLGIEERSTQVTDNLIFIANHYAQDSSDGELIDLVNDFKKEQHDISDCIWLVLTVMDKLSNTGESITGTPSKLTLISPPNNTNYHEGDTVDFSGTVLNVDMTNGKKYHVRLSSDGGVMNVRETK